MSDFLILRWYVYNIFWLTNFVLSKDIVCKLKFVYLGKYFLWYSTILQKGFKYEWKGTKTEQNSFSSLRKWEYTLLQKYDHYLYHQNIIGYWGFCGRCVSLKLMVLPQRIYIFRHFLSLFLTLRCGTFYKTTTTSKQKQVLGYQKISKYFLEKFWVVQKGYVSHSSSSLVDHLSFFRETKHKNYNLGKNLLYPSENSLKITIRIGNNIY